MPRAKRAATSGTKTTPSGGIGKGKKDEKGPKKGLEKIVDVAKIESKPSKKQPGKKQPEQKKPEQKQPEQKKPEQSSKKQPEQKKPEQKQPEQKKPEQKQPEQKKPEQEVATLSRKHKRNRKQPEQKQPEQKQKPEKKQPEQKQPGKKQPEQKKPEQKQPEQKKPEQEVATLSRKQKRKSKKEAEKKPEIVEEFVEEAEEVAKESEESAESDESESEEAVEKMEEASSSEVEEKQVSGKRKAPATIDTTPTKKQKTGNSAPTESHRVVAENLLVTISQDEIEKFFADCSVKKVVMIESASGNFVGKATLTFGSEADAKLAIAKSGRVFAGRPLRVKPTPPPSKCLFISRLPAATTQAQLSEILSVHGEIAEVRLTQGKTCLAFIEFVDIESSKAAVAAHEEGLTVNGENVTVDFAFSAREEKQGGGRAGDRRSTGSAGDRRSTGSAGAGAGRPVREKTPKPVDGKTFFVGNLPYSVEEQHIKDAFRGCSISNIRWLERDGEFKGVAYIEFADTHVADKAMALSTNGLSIGGRDARVDWTTDNRPRK